MSCCFCFTITTNSLSKSITLLARTFINKTFITKIPLKKTNCNECYHVEKWSKSVFHFIAIKKIDNINQASFIFNKTFILEIAILLTWIKEVFWNTIYCKTNSANADIANVKSILKRIRAIDGEFFTIQDFKNQVIEKSPHYLLIKLMSINDS